MATNTTHAFGDLLVTLTSEYELRYRDSGSGADTDGAYYHPRSQVSMFACEVPASTCTCGWDGGSCP